MSENLHIPLAKHRHPVGLWYLSASYALLMMAYGALLSLLTLYFRHLHLGASNAYSLFAAFAALTWVATFIAGFMCSRFGYKQVALAGCVVTLLGTATLCLPSLNAVYVGLAIYIIGYGLSTTAFFSLVGLLYQRNDRRRDSGYTLFYLLLVEFRLFYQARWQLPWGINLFLSSVVSPYFCQLCFLLRQ